MICAIPLHISNARRHILHAYQVTFFAVFEFCLIIYIYVFPLLLHINQFNQAYPKYSFNYGIKDPHTGDIKSQVNTNKSNANVVLFQLFNINIKFNTKLQAEERDGDVVKGIKQTITLTKTFD